MSIQVMAIAVTIIAALSFGSGYKLCDLLWESAKLEEINNIKAERDAAESKYQKAAKRLIAAKENRRVKYREKIVKIPTHVVGDCHLDDPGMQELSCAVRPSRCATVTDGNTSRAAAPTEQ